MLPDAEGSHDWLGYWRPLCTHSSGVKAWSGWFLVLLALLGFWLRSVKTRFPGWYGINSAARKTTSHVVIISRNLLVDLAKTTLGLLLAGWLHSRW